MFVRKINIQNCKLRFGDFRRGYSLMSMISEIFEVLGNSENCFSETKLRNTGYEILLRKKNENSYGLLSSV